MPNRRKRYTVDEERKILEKALGQNFEEPKLFMNDVNIIDKLCGKDILLRYIFIIRFLWFLSEIEAHINQNKAENDLTLNPEFQKLPEEKQNELLKPIYDNWRYDFFSPESFDKFIKEKIGEMKFK